MKTAVQIGTNDTSDSFYDMCERGKHDRVFLVEPHTKYNDIIHKKYESVQHQISNIAIVPDGSISETNLYILSDNGQHDSLLNRREHDWKKDGRSIHTMTVPCMTLNAFFDRNNISDIDLLHIDMEGLDEPCLLGLYFGRVKIRKIIWEMWAHVDDDDNHKYRTGPDVTNKLVEKLSALGYKISRFDAANWQAVMPPKNEALPWIELDDKFNAYKAEPFLPKNPVIFEAGCCAADDTLRFKDIWPKSTVYTFEPNVDLYAIAKRNLESKYGTTTEPVLNSIIRWSQHGINLYPYVLSDMVSTVTFYKSEFPGTSSLFKNNFQNIVVPRTVLDSIKVKEQGELKIYDETPVNVQAVSIDQLRSMENIPEVDYLWLDTEGAELKILNGAKNTIKTVRVISIEFNMQEFREGMAQFDDVYDFLVSNAFCPVAMWKAHENWQSNGVFVREDLL